MVQVSVSAFSFALGTCPEEGRLDHRVALVLVWPRTLPTALHGVCPSSARRPLSPHTPAAMLSCISLQSLLSLVTLGVDGGWAAGEAPRRHGGGRLFLGPRTQWERDAQGAARVPPCPAVSRRGARTPPPS